MIIGKRRQRREPKYYRKEMLLLQNISGENRHGIINILYGTVNVLDLSGAAHLFLIREIISACCLSNAGLSKLVFSGACMLTVISAQFIQF